MNKSRKLAGIFGFVILNSVLFFRANAQNPSSYYIEEPKLFTGGMVAGANFCQIDGDKYAGYFKPGINAGAILYAHVGNNLKLSMELLYVEKGARSNFRQNSSNNLYTIITQRANLSYAEIPVMANLFDKNKSHVGLGVSYARLINAEEVIVTSPANTYDPDKFPFLKSDFNFIASGNLYLTKGLYANLRFQYSLRPIRKNVDYEFARAEQYNNLWVIRIMYLF